MNDQIIAKKYLNKISNAHASGHEFKLSLMSFSNMMRAKRCRFTGLSLTVDTISIDRIDNSLGYVDGNVCACHEHFNQLKGVVERPDTQLTLENVTKGFNLVLEEMAKAEKKRG